MATLENDGWKATEDELLKLLRDLKGRMRLAMTPEGVHPQSLVDTLVRLAADKLILEHRVTGLAALVEELIVDLPEEYMEGATARLRAQVDALRNALKEQEKPKILQPPSNFDAKRNGR